MVTGLFKSATYSQYINSVSDYSVRTNLNRKQLKERFRLLGNSLNENQSTTTTTTTEEGGYLGGYFGGKFWGIF
jgi:hypothetical protein